MSLAGERTGVVQVSFDLHENLSSVHDRTTILHVLYKITSKLIIYRLLN